MLRQQSVLAHFGRFALRSDSLDAILTEACRLAGEALGTNLAKVMELQPDGQALLIRAGVGWKPGVVGQTRLQVEGTSPEGVALRFGKPVSSADIEKDDRFQYAAVLKDNGVRALINVIIIGGRGRPPFGLLQVADRVPRRFTRSDTAFLRGYANLLSAAVGRLRSLEEAREANRLLERRVGARTRALTIANARLRAEVQDSRRLRHVLRDAGKLEAAFEHLPIGVGLIGHAGQVIFANPEFRRLLPDPGGSSVATRSAGPWSAIDAAGGTLALADFPVSRALRGELALDVDFRFRDPEDRVLWRRVSGIPVRSPAGRITAALVVMTDVDEAKRAAERQTLLAREVDHRAKNMLAVVLAALRLTRADSIQHFVRAIEGRVMALARAQTLLAADHWSGADLGGLLRGELLSFLDRLDAGPRAQLQGAAVTLPARAAQPIAMAIHELATNAVKYGALSASTGLLSIRWELGRAAAPGRGAGPVLRLHWTETGGPPVGLPPARQGFGTRMLARLLRDQLGGEVALEWRPAGLDCTLELPLDPEAAAD